ncbi:hypothetical protein [Pedobacter segetis]|uniref:hypothetical protein n=1 Tax=Pedobacter segetis TaxID=2793069 RepID=UPI00190D1109|nr:hypothetical protein [Pedobacter segetis]
MHNDENIINMFRALNNIIEMERSEINSKLYIGADFPLKKYSESEAIQLIKQAKDANP